VTADAITVLIDSNGQFGTLSSSLCYEDVREMGIQSADLMRLRAVTFRYKQVVNPMLLNEVQKQHRQIADHTARRAELG